MNLFLKTKMDCWI